MCVWPYIYDGKECEPESGDVRAPLRMQPPEAYGARAVTDDGAPVVAAGRIVREPPPRTIKVVKMDLVSCRILPSKKVRT